MTEKSNVMRPAEIFQQFIIYHKPKITVWENSDFSFCAHKHCADCKIEEVCDAQPYKGLHHGEDELDEIKKEFPEFFI